MIRPDLPLGRRLATSPLKPHVPSPDGHHVSEALDQMRRRLQYTIDELTLNAVVLDQEGIIVAVNRAWSTSAERHGIQQSWIGVDYLRVCDDAKGEEVQQARHVAAGIRHVISGIQPTFRCVYGGPVNARRPQWYFLRAMRLDPLELILVAHERI